MDYNSVSINRKAEDLLFVDVSMDPKYTSKVWEHFKLEKFADIAQCNECEGILILYILQIQN